MKNLHFKTTDYYLALKPVSVLKFSISVCAQVCFCCMLKDLKRADCTLNNSTFITVQNRSTLPLGLKKLHKEAETQRRNNN